MALCPKSKSLFLCNSQGESALNTRLLDYKIFTTYHELPTAWDEILPSNALFLQRNYLKANEAALHHIRFYYVAYYNAQGIAGVAYFQRFRIVSGVKLTSQQLFTKNPWSYLKEKISNFIKWKINLLPLEILINGNAFITGCHNYFFIPGIETAVIQQSVINSIADIEEIEKNKGKEINVIMLKDFGENIFDKADPFLQEFQLMPSQPMMNMQLRPSWKTFDAYLSDFSSKYRVRARSARKKSTDLISELLDLDFILQENKNIFRLYHQVAMNAEFNISFLHKDYFYQMAAAMPNQFFMKGYFKEEKLVGFISWFIADDHFDAHFLGYDDQVNHDYKLYQNMLYDLTEECIKAGCKVICYGRTAMEIKSTIGAIPNTSTILLKHTNRVLNKLLFAIFSQLNNEEWVQRHPFKED